MANYQRLPTDEANDKSINVIVKWKEASYSINILKNATVLDLKSKIENATDISKDRQRLIFSGKSLKPDNSLLLSYKLVDGSVIQLFPLNATPENISASNAPTSSSNIQRDNSSTNSHEEAAENASIAMQILLSYMNNIRARREATESAGNMQLPALSRNSGGHDSTSNPVVNSTNNASAIPTTYMPNARSTNNVNVSNTVNTESELNYLTEMHFDLELLKLATAVQWWCVILSISSVWVLIEGLIVLLSTGSFGDGVFDNVINICIYFSCVLCMHVSREGVIAGRTMRTGNIKKYMENLFPLCCFCIGVRLMWVVDVYMTTASKVYGSQGTVEYVEDDIQYDDVHIDSTAEESGAVPEAAIGAATVEACAIALIVVVFWLKIYSKSKMFQSAVINYGAEHEVEMSSSPTESGAPTVVENPQNMV